MTTAGALIIGDEILSGKVHDKNSHVLSKVLFERGVRLQSIETIPDDVDEIVFRVKHLSKKYDYVFTSGGIGPTHDDKTYASIAKVFNRQLVYHQETIDALSNHLKQKGYDGSVSDARKRMALLPTPCKIISIANLWVPLVVVDNVYILPGVPELFELMLFAAKENFSGTKLTRRLVYTHLKEDDIAFLLEEIQCAYPEIAIGSYPQYRDVGYKVMVSCEGESQELVCTVAELICSRVEGFYDV